MSLLNKAVQQINQARKQRNVVVEVLGFKLNPEGTNKDQILVGRDIDSGKEINIIMGKAPTEESAAKRTTIPQLQSMEKRKAEVGGYVRVDGLRTGTNGLHEAKFVKTIKRSAEDADRHFFKMKARVFPARGYENTSYGETVVNHVGRVELMDDTVVRPVTTAEEFQETVAAMLLEGTPHAAGLGENVVFLRDSPFAKTLAIRAKSVKQENGVYRKPTKEEIMVQMADMPIVAIVSGGLAAAGGKASIDLIPGASHMVVGKTASGPEYKNQAGIFFKGKFKIADEKSGELKEVQAAGFREAIIGLGRAEKNGSSMWFVNSVSATQVDNLTLNGLSENEHLWQDAEQSAQQSTEQKTSTNQQEAQQAPAERLSEPQPARPAKQQAAEYQSTADEYYGNTSLDDLLDEGDHMDDDLVNRAASAFQTMG